MDLVKNFLGGALGFAPNVHREFFVNFVREYRAFWLCTFAIITLGGQGVWYFNSQDLATVFTTKIDLNKSSNLISLGEAEKIEIKNLIKKNMSYSYANTELGFYLKDMTFFDGHSKTDVEQKILKNLPPFLAKKAKRYIKAVLTLSEFHQVDPIWILSVMWTESHFDYSAKSWAGARGLMQIMPETRKFVYQQYRNKGNLLIVEKKDFNMNRFFSYKVSQKQYKAHIKKLVNIELGIIYLKKLLKKFKSHKYATVAYNMGPGWTRYRLRKKLPVGQNNLYLDKVRKAYKQIVSRI